MEEAVRVSCPNEPQFREMYKVLGNKAEQDKIRAAHKLEKGATKYNHCKHLRSNPNACVRFPQAGGAFDICKHNPFHPDRMKDRAKANERLKQIRPFKMNPKEEQVLLAVQNKAYRDIELGIASLETLTPIEYLIAAVKKDEVESAFAKAQAQLIGAYVAKGVAQIMAKMMAAPAPAPGRGIVRGRRSRV